MDAVDAALADVPETLYVLQPDGHPLPQTSNPAIIAAMLRLLDVAPGSRVLEIGTGSGYSTALLSHLVGTPGGVISLEVDSDVAERARLLLAEQSVSNATVAVANGQNGYPPAAPFDRIVAWASAGGLPQAWVSQVKVGGLVVAPVQLAPLAHAVAVVRVRREAEQKVVGERIIPGSFVPLTSAPLFDWGKAPDEADVVVEAERDPATWVSAQWLRRGNVEAKATRLRDLCFSLSVRASPLSSREGVDALRAYLLAALPEGLTTAFLQATGRAIDCSNAESLALLSLRDGTLAEAGDGSATTELMRWVEDWRARGRPDFDQMKPSVEQTAQGWTVRARLNQP